MAAANKKATQSTAAPKAVPAAKPATKAVVKPFKKRAPLIRRTDAEWLAIFQEQANSNMNLEDYCKPKGMSPSSFSVKRKTLTEKYNIEDISVADLSKINFGAQKPPAKSAAAKPAMKKAVAAKTPAEPGLESATTTPPAKTQPAAPALGLIKTIAKTKSEKTEGDDIRMVLDDQTTLYVPREGAAQFIAEYMALRTTAKK